MEISEAFGLVLKKYRKMANISQEELSNRCDLDRTFISLLERGKRNPTLQTIFKISTSLNTLPSQIIKETEEMLNFHKF